ncbi:MAG: adenylate/guanylate cyclase domain-containing protein [Nevskiales bacterium]
MVGLAPMLAVLVSVIFNVWYSVIYIKPLLTPYQHQLLQQSLLLFNLVAFPLAGALWGGIVASLRRPLCALQYGQQPDVGDLARAQARAINLPWHFAAIVLAANLAVGLILQVVVTGSQEPVFESFSLHLLIAISIAALITITIAFFLIELLVLLLIFPLLFSEGRPYETRGALPLSLPMRAVLMAVAGGIGPIIMLLLIGWADDAQRGASLNMFRLAVGLLGVSFSLIGAVLFGRLVMNPIRKLSQASQSVAAGNLATRIRLQRADEFGALADEFNRMVGELGEKQRLRETFGLHVGEGAAEQILARDPGLGGQLREITALFCDIRGFTALSADLAPAEVVARLNAFLGVMVDVVELQHGGMVNKYLGDGFMALFGASGRESAHAEAAVYAARDMLAAETAFSIGIGIHTGTAIVGNIGSPRRLEYTAIGDTINLAARLEGLTKTLGAPVLFSRTTRDRLPDAMAVRNLGSHAVRGQPAPVEIFSL